MSENRDEGGVVGLSIPTVHMNGTSKADLLDQLREAWEAMCAALDQAGKPVYPTRPRVYRTARQGRLLCTRCSFLLAGGIAQRKVA